MPLLLCLALLNTLENEIRLLWVLVIYCSRHRAKLMHLSVCQLSVLSNNIMAELMTFLNEVECC